MKFELRVNRYKHPSYVAKGKVPRFMYVVGVNSIRWCMRKRNGDEAGLRKRVDSHGTCERRFLSLPGGYVVEQSREIQSYVDLVGLGKYSLDWIIDEFDASFNDLAVGALKYHMHYAVTVCYEETYQRYEALVRDLESNVEGARERFLEVVPELWS